MLVHDRMTAPVVTISPDAVLRDALKLMHAHRIRRLPVVGESGLLVGIVSERDIPHTSPSRAGSLSVWDLNYLLSQVQICEIMTEDVITTTPDTPIEDVAWLMIHTTTGGLPVLDEQDHVVGMITETDIFRAFVEMFAGGRSGLRLTLEVPEGEEVLLGLSGAISELGGQIVSVGSFSPDVLAKRGLVIKVRDASKKQLVDTLEALGDHVVDARDVVAHQGNSAPIAPVSRSTAGTSIEKRDTQENPGAIEARRELMKTRQTDSRQTGFTTPERFAAEQAERMESPRGPLLIASCHSGCYLAQRVLGQYQDLLSEAGSQGSVRHLDSVDFQFSDSETCVRLDMDVSGYDVFLFQALYAPFSGRSVDQNYMAFLTAARAFRECGANYVTGILPYLAYARQDKPTKFQREPTTAQLMAHFAIEAGISRLVTWHPHASQIHGFYGGLPVDALDPLPLFVDVFRRFAGQNDVIVVAPDAGASKLVTYFGRALDLPCAIASKYRPRREVAVITEIIGDFSGKRTAIVLDDMISSGGTVEATVEELLRRNGVNEIYLAVSHNLCRDVAIERMAWLHDERNLREVIVTNSIPQTPEFEALPFTSVRCLADTLARVVNRIHYNRSVTDLSTSPSLTDSD